MSQPLFEVDALLFDMDGTLVDSTPVVEHTWRRWAEQHGLDPASVVHFAHGRPTAETIRHYKPELDAGVEAGRLLTEEELDPTPCPALPGAMEAVSFGAQHGKWAVVTSAPRNLALQRLERAGFPRPEVLVSADDILRGKPNPEGYLAAAEQLGCVPVRCAVFEDTPAGLQAGRTGGMKTVGLATTFNAGELEADIVIPNLASAVFEVHEGGVLSLSFGEILRRGDVTVAGD